MPTIAHLECRDGRSDKFYRIVYNDDTVVTCWGRRGGKGRTEVTRRTDAMYAGRDLAYRKQSRGYRLVHQLTVAGTITFSTWPDTVASAGLLFSQALAGALTHTAELVADPSRAQRAESWELLVVNDLAGGVKALPGVPELVAGLGRWRVAHDDPSARSVYLLPEGVGSELRRVLDLHRGPDGERVTQTLLHVDSPDDDGRASLLLGLTDRHAKGNQCREAFATASLLAAG